ncbi:patatin-like phospholipase family protein [Sorangium sp. So ce385]|uniref:patatin-like phospholipase family protein n=1 Tax=Sorangium sp. So ce385 TaxID=3133308 RepID=UPI003F5B840D
MANVAPVSTRYGRAPKIALVLAGGAARGAYEVGVVQHILEEVSRDLGREAPLDILCGTSVGAINVCGLAAFADEARSRARRLAAVWTRLRIDDLVRLDVRGVLAVGHDLLRGGAAGAPASGGHAALLDTSGLERQIAEAVPFERIDGHLERGLLSAVTVSTTLVKSGRTVVFVHRREPGLPPWSHDPTISPRATAIRAEHALASSALPILFRPVSIDGELYCDGGLRQNVPLSPARRLGADGVIVVNPRYIEPASAAPERDAPGFPGPLFLLGKTLNALMLDRIDNDLARLESINGILEAGRRRYGEGFVDALNDELGLPPGRTLRPLRSLLIRASKDIGSLAAEFVRSPAFRARTTSVLGRVMRRLAEGDEQREADFLSYLLFDGEFAGRLIEIGRADARARHEELCAFFERALSFGGFEASAREGG